MFRYQYPIVPLIILHSIFSNQYLLVLLSVRCLLLIILNSVFSDQYAHYQCHQGPVLLFFNVSGFYTTHDYLPQGGTSQWILWWGQGQRQRKRRLLGCLTSLVNDPSLGTCWPLGRYWHPEPPSSLAQCEIQFAVSDTVHCETVLALQTLVDCGVTQCLCALLPGCVV